MTKICVYAIAKDEEQFVDRFMDSVRDADLVVVGDTGSTDDTVEKLRERGAVVHNIDITPWRFDNARNAVLELIPDEYDCLFSLDLDEQIETDDWKIKLEQKWAEHTTRAGYYYTWKLDENGKPEKRYIYDKIHNRNYRWVYPCHEVLHTEEEEEYVFVDIEVVHRPDGGKNRGYYLDLLELSVSENPEDHRSLHYWGRELFYKRDKKCVDILSQHADIEGAWDAERAASCMMLAEYFWDSPKADTYYKKACLIAPGERDPYVDYAKYLLLHDRFEECYRYATKAMSITERCNHYLESRYAWNEGPYDLAGNSAYQLGDVDKAREYINKAHELNPDDKRLEENTHKNFTHKNYDIASTYITCAVDAWESKDYMLSRKFYHKAKEIAPGHPLVRDNKTWYPNPHVSKRDEYRDGAYANAKISVLVVSYERPDLAKRLQDSAISTAVRPDLVEVIVVSDLTDCKKAEYIEMFGHQSICAAFPTMVKWNVAASMATGEIFMLVCDDVIFKSDGWDEVLRKLWPDDGLAVMYGCSASGPMICEFPIISTKMIEKVGYAAYPNLRHSGLDVWWQEIGSELNRLYFVGDLVDMEHAHEGGGGARSRTNRYEKEDAIHTILANNSDIMAEDVEKLKLMMSDDKGIYLT